MENIPEVAALNAQLFYLHIKNVKEKRTRKYLVSSEASMHAQRALNIRSGTWK
jgi:hypothetical protein